MHSTTSAAPARIGALVFLLAAVGYIVWYGTQQPIPEGASLADFILYVLQTVPSVVAILLPAVILVRHPDAWWTARTLLFGAVLLAVVPALIILAQPLQGYFEALTPPNEDLPLVTLAEVYRAVILLVGVTGLAYIGLGLSMARRYVDVGPGWATAWFVPGATIFGAIVGVLAAQGQIEGVSMTPALFIYVGSSVILGVLRIAVWAFLASVLTRGWAAGEDPRSGWGLATAATVLVIVALVIINLGGMIGITDEAIGTVLGYVTVVLYSGGHLLLLAGFAVGLPAIDEPEAPDTDDDDEDDAVDEFEDEDEDEDGTGHRGRGRRRRARRRLVPFGRQCRGEVAHEVEPLIDLFDGCVRTRHQEARTSRQGHAGELAPRFGQRPPRADGRRPLVDEHDRGRPPDGDLLPERPDAGGQLRVRRLVTRGRDLEQVRDAVARGHERVVGILDRAWRDDPCRHQPLPEGLAEPTLVVVAGRDADWRRVEPDEQQTVALGWQVGQRFDGGAVDLDRRSMGTRSGTPGQGVELVLGHARTLGRLVAAGVRRIARRAGLDLRLRGRGLGLGLLDAAPQRLADLRQGLGTSPQDGEHEDDDEDQQEVRHAGMVQRPVSEAGARRG